MLTKISAGHYTATVANANVTVSKLDKKTWLVTADDTATDNRLMQEQFRTFGEIEALIEAGTLAKMIEEERAAQQPAPVYEPEPVEQPIPEEVLCDTASAPAPQMNDRQAATVEKLRQLLTEKNAKIGRTDVKKLEVKVDAETGLVFVVAEFGMPGDEGTVAQALWRDYRHILIGLKGGIQLLNASNLRKDVGMGNAVYATTREARAVLKSAKE